MRTLLPLVLLSLVVVGCTSKIEGTLKVDGQTFEIEKCRSGQAFGFTGVQFNGKDGRRLRVFTQPDGTAAAALFPNATSPTGDRLGSCGSLVVKMQNSTINNIKNIKGSAELTCQAAGHSVSGNVRFENCH